MRGKSIQQPLTGQAEVSHGTLQPTVSPERVLCPRSGCPQAPGDARLSQPCSPLPRACQRQTDPGAEPGLVHEPGASWSKPRPCPGRRPPGRWALLHTPAAAPHPPAPPEPPRRAADVPRWGQRGEVWVCRGRSNSLGVGWHQTHTTGLSRAGGAGKGTGKMGRRKGAEWPAGPPALQPQARGAAMCPAPSMGWDWAEHEAKPRRCLCTDPGEEQDGILTEQDRILLSPTTRELAKSLEPGGEATPPQLQPLR